MLHCHLIHLKSVFDPIDNWLILSLFLSLKGNWVLKQLLIVYRQRLSYVWRNSVTQKCPKPQEHNKQMFSISNKTLEHLHSKQFCKWPSHDCCHRAAPSSQTKLLFPANFKPAEHVFPEHRSCSDVRQSFITA